ncbi:MAG: MBL fold metallo-hydrolase, partial [Alphaproteobacteria bacterium]|nr:MBL fold metallo-hydrolase [Alphaproteobacteria bacterium]
METLRFGEVTVDRLVKAEGLSFFSGFLLPDSDDEALAAQRPWLEPQFFDGVSGRLVMSVHCYVIRTARHTILVDTCVGNHKERPSTPPWHRMETPWLANLAAAGVAPEEVDFVLCTHLHVDHVGWNTRLRDGRWVPTFPNARYLFHRVEYEHWEATDDFGSGTGAGDGCFADSVLPVMEAGQALLVAGDHQIDDNLWLGPSPGHSPGHVCLYLSAGGGRAV